MSITRLQYRDIMHEYDLIRSENYQKQVDRKEKIYLEIPEIKDIDDQIAHISVETAKYMLFHPGENKRPEAREKTASLKKQKISLLLEKGYPSDYLDPVYTCKDCKDSGYIGDEKCHCFKKMYSKYLYESSHLEDILREENFDHFCMEYYSDRLPAPNLSGISKKEADISPRENMQSLLKDVYEYIEHFSSENESNLLIFGNTGVGKTFLSNCIADEILKKSYSVIYLTAQQLFKELENYTFRTKHNSSDELPDFLTCDLLIIDDLGTELNNAFINTQLFLCMNERILKKKSTLINTNLDLGQISRIYTERVSSRIIAHYKILHIYGEDIRISKAFL